MVTLDAAPYTSNKSSCPWCLGISIKAAGMTTYTTKAIRCGYNSRVTHPGQIIISKTRAKEGERFQEVSGSCFDP